MKILVVDSELNYSAGGSFCRGFAALGHETRFFDQARWVGGWVSTRRATRLLRIAARPASIPALNFALLTTAYAWKPDLVLIMKGWYILPETIDALRRGARYVISYQTDDLENPLNTNERMIQSIPKWDVMFSSRRFVRDELLARGARQVEILPFAYDPLMNYPMYDAPPVEPGLDNAVTFVGTWAPERFTLFDRVASQLPLRVWGNGWQGTPTSSPLRPALRLKALIDDPLRAVLSQSAINIALLRHANRDQHVMRTFEIPATGGFMLAERSDEHLELFEEGKEAAYFGSPEELVEQAHRYLRDAPLRRRIAEAGYRRVTTSGHRYQDRAARMLQVLGER